jgi:hypothetical protein
MGLPHWPMINQFYECSTSDPLFTLVRLYLLRWGPFSPLVDPLASVNGIPQWSTKHQLIYSHVVDSYHWGLERRPWVWGFLHLQHPSQVVMEYITYVWVLWIFWGHFPQCPLSSWCICCDIDPHCIFLWLWSYWWDGSIMYSFVAMVFYFMSWIHIVLFWRPCFNTL